MANNYYRDDMIKLYDYIENEFPWLENSIKNFGYDLKSNRAKHLDEAAACRDTDSFIKIVKEASMLLQQGHFKLNESTNKKNHFFPFEIMYVQGRYYVVDFTANKFLEEGNIREGDRIIGINDESVDTYINGLKGEKLLQYDNKRGRLFIKDRIWTSPLAENLNITFQKQNGSQYTYRIKTLGQEEMIKNIDTEALLKTSRLISYTKEDDKLYIKVPSFDEKYLKQNRDIFQKALSKKDYDSVILDIRGNGGGTDEYFSELIMPELLKGNYKAEYNIYNSESGEYEKFKDIINGRADKDYNIKLLSDEKVFSAADGLAMFCKTTGCADIIGTPTSGDGIGYSSSTLTLDDSKLSLTLPNSKLYDDRGRQIFSTEPDYYEEQKYCDFMAYIEEKKCRGQESSREIFQKYDSIKIKADEILEKDKAKIVEDDLEL